jgi:transketolase
MSTQAGSGHPTSSLSGVELMAGLLFGGIFRYDLNQPKHPNNDRLIFSKGHASPLFYALWAAAGKLTEAELMTYRHFGSPLEGHPTPVFPLVEAATGSLGQGLSIGVGQALNAKYLDKLLMYSWGTARWRKAPNGKPSNWRPIMDWITWWESWMSTGWASGARPCMAGT